MKLTSYLLIVILVATLFGALPPAPVTAAYITCPSGISDQFGYCLDTPTFNWETGIDYTKDNTNPDYLSWRFPGGYEDLTTIPLTFTFPFYENAFEKSFSKVRISANGMLFFGNQFPTGYTSLNLAIPTEQAPYNYIAPFWSTIGIGETDSRVGDIFFHEFLDQTPRYAVIEWRALELKNGAEDGAATYDTDTSLMFQAVIYDNGDIRFNYSSMDYSDSSAKSYPFTVGIENSDGVDGLQVSFNDSSPITGGSSYLFTYPGAGIRYGARASAQAVGGFIDSKIADIPITVVNTSTERTSLWLACQGVDSQSGSGSWSVKFLNADKSAELFGDFCYGQTPAMDPGESMTVYAHVSVLGGQAGSYAIYKIHVTANVPPRPMPQPDYPETDFVVHMNVAVPAYFVQSYAQTGMGMGLRFIRPVDSGLSIPDTRYTGKTLTLAGTARDGYIYAWESQTDNGANILYTTATSLGKVAGEPVALQENTATNIYDQNPKVAVYNGLIGFVFARRNSSTSVWNLFMTIMDINGNPLVKPFKNITDNTLPEDQVSFDDPPAIVGLPNNEFMVIYRQTGGTGASQTGDLYSKVYRIGGTAGHLVLNLQNEVRLTYGEVGVTQYMDPDLVLLKDNRVLMTYTVQSSDPAVGKYISYMVLSTDGSVSQAIDLYKSSAENGEVVQLSNGNILIGWKSNLTSPSQVAYEVLNQDLTPIKAATFLSVAHGTTYQVGMSKLSATTSGGNFVITWGDAGREKIYYALIDGNIGTFITPPMEYLHDQGDWIVLSETGEGIAPMMETKDYRYFFPLVTKVRK